MSIARSPSSLSSFSWISGFQVEGYFMLRDVSMMKITFVEWTGMP